MNRLLRHGILATGVLGSAIIAPGCGSEATPSFEPGVHVYGRAHEGIDRNNMLSVTVVTCSGLRVEPVEPADGYDNILLRNPFTNQQTVGALAAIAMHINSDPSPQAGTDVVVPNSRWCAVDTEPMTLRELTKKVNNYNPDDIKRQNDPNDAQAYIDFNFGDGNGVLAGFISNDGL